MATEPDLPPLPRHWTRVPPGRVLAFAPHPDDELAGPGGALALHHSQGDAVRVVVATDGSNGDPDRRYDPAGYAALRRDESRRGLGELGIGDVQFWGLPDGRVPSAADLEHITGLAAAAVAAFAPTIVYLPWEHEGHPDHHALHVVVTRALDRARWPGLALGYEVWNAMLPDAVLDVTAVIEHKRRALHSHRSQLAYVQYDHCVLGLNAYRSAFHQRGHGYAEAFRIVRGAPPSGFA